MGRESDHIRQAWNVNGYPVWMLVDPWISDQWDQGEEEEEDGRQGKDEEKEMKQSVPASTKSPVGPRVLVTKKKYPVVLLYVR